MHKRSIIRATACIAFVLLSFAAYSYYFTSMGVSTYDPFQTQNSSSQAVVMIKDINGSQTENNVVTSLLQSVNTDAHISLSKSVNIDIPTEMSSSNILTEAPATTTLTRKGTTIASSEAPAATTLTKVSAKIITTGKVTTNISSEADTMVQQIYAMMKKQLELSVTFPKVSITGPCNSNQKWKKACVEKNCPQLNTDLQERVKSLFSDSTVLTKSQDDLLTSIAAQIPENDVILLSAISDDHFDESQAMFHTLHTVVYPELTKHENFSMVLWDLGLSPTHRKQMEKCCRCQVVTFPFDKFTNRMRELRCYMWKPLVIRMMQTRARKYVVWQDASIRYTRYPGPVFERGMKYGMQLLRQKIGVSVSERTLPETFAFFGQQSCNFRPFPEIAATFGVYRNDPFVLQAVTSPWARCGFEERCMCPRHAGRSHRCVYGPCHRFDQSALSIITDTLYSSEVYRILMFQQEMLQNFWVGRNHKEENYFNTIGCSPK